MLNQDTRLLIISPHPDDETLGCGGLMRRVKLAGGKVFVLVMTYGDEPQYGGVSRMESRPVELEQAMKCLEVDDYEVLFAGDKYHLRLDTLPEKEILDKIEKSARLNLNSLSPTMVGIPAGSSYNVDHRVTWQCAFTALRPRPHHLKSYAPLVFTYDHLNLWCSEPFFGNWFVDIGSVLEDKLAALALYATQMREDPHERSLANIRRYHELLGRSQGVLAVEQFQINRLYL